jgi:hypothetical protein
MTGDTMETIALELARQVPSLVVLVWMVSRFLTFTKRIGEALDRNSEVHGRVLECLRRINGGREL